MENAAPLTEQELTSIKKRRAAVRASFAISGMYLTEEEEQLFEQMDKERLSADERTQRIIKFNQERRAERQGVQMNSISRKPLKAPKDGRAFREAGVRYANASVRLEGFETTDTAKQLDRRYIDGEITAKEATSILLKHHGLK